MDEKKLDALISDISDIKTGVTSLRQDHAKLHNLLLIVDKRLSLIEQRLSNIEPWISVDNSPLEYSPEKQAVA